VGPGIAQLGVSRLRSNAGDYDLDRERSRGGRGGTSRPSIVIARLSLDWFQ